MRRPPPRPFRALAAASLLTAVVLGGMSADHPPRPTLGPPDDRAPVPFRVAADVPLAVEILTTADLGGRIGHSLRWEGPEVTYRIDVHHTWTAALVAVIEEALEWAAEASELTYVEAAGDAEAALTIRGRDRPGGRVRVYPDGGAIRSADVELGCCSTRAAFEEVAQSLGVLADLGDDRSVFSDNRTRLRPSDWDRWVVRALYSLPPGASPDELQRELATTAAEFTG